MPVLKFYHHGMTAGTPPARNDHLRAKRDRVEGWSAGSTRRNTRFLYSIREGDLTGYGQALTLTVRDCPQTHDDWHRMRTSFFKRLRRMGMIRAHWVTEWQRRGVPHLHCAVWFDRPEPQSETIRHWWDISKSLRSGFGGQHCAPIHDQLGWFQYLSKHASRGLSHYQRSPENVPQGWKKTGRMWGHIGDWPVDDEIKLEVTFDAFHRFRRTIRNYVIAIARASGNRKRITYTRKMLSCSDPDMSRVKGLSEWIPLDTQIQIAVWLKTQGYSVDHG